MNIHHNTKEISLPLDEWFNETLMWTLEMADAHGCRKQAETAIKDSIYAGMLDACLGLILAYMNSLLKSQGLPPVTKEQLRERVEQSKQ